VSGSPVRAQTSKPAVAASGGPRMPAWKAQLRAAVRDPHTLLAALELDGHPLARRLDEGPVFATRVPRPYIARMQPRDPDDPLLRQVLPLAAERDAAAGFVADPLAEREHNPLPGVVRKYGNRALLIAAGGCAVHCRYCFRREFPYAENNPGRQGWSEAVAWLQAAPEIEEIILSGGDPLMLDDEALGELIHRLGDVAHLRRLRVHTRLPIVIPERVTTRLVAALTHTRLKPVLVVHANHANELDAATRDALEPLRAARVGLLNQAVLLAGVNDRVDALANLCETAFDAGITPYYLHLLDPVHGTAHYEVPAARARALYGELLARLPGYLVPRLVREVAGDPAKRPILPDWAQ